MKRYITFVLGLILLLGFAQCKKETYVPTDRTNFSIKIERDEFQDTIYQIDLLDVSSSDDDIIELAKVLITDNNGAIIFDDFWQNARNFKFSLHQRAKINVKVELYRIAEEGREIIESKSILLDNIRYPDFINISQIVVDTDLSSIQYLSSNYSTRIDVFSFFDDVGYVYYWSKFYQPKILVYNFSTLRLSTRDAKYSDRLMDYWIEVNYAKELPSSGTFYEYENYDVQFDINKIFEMGNTEPNTPYTLEFKSSSNYDAGFTIYYTVIYEN